MTCSPVGRGITRVLLLLQEDDEEEDDYGEGSMTNGAAVRLCADPAVAERLYCVNTAGECKRTRLYQACLDLLLESGSGGLVPYELK